MLSLFYDEHSGMNTAGVSSIPKGTLLAPAFPEFEGIFAATYKEKSNQYKKLRAQLRQKQMNGEVCVCVCACVFMFVCVCLFVCLCVCVYVYAYRRCIIRMIIF